MSENSSKWGYTLCGAAPLMLASIFHFVAISDKFMLRLSKVSHVFDFYGGLACGGW